MFCIKIVQYITPTHISSNPSDYWARWDIVTIVDLRRECYNVASDRSLYVNVVSRYIKRESVGPINNLRSHIYKFGVLTV